MIITDKLRGEPYNYTADKEYYDKGYRALVGVPGRVLQAKELSAMSMYPIYAMNDIASVIFEEGVINGLDYSNDVKLENGSISGITLELNDILEQVKLVDLDANNNVEGEVSYTLDELKNNGILNNFLGIDEEELEETENATEDSNVDNDVEGKDDEEYSVTVYNADGDERWPKNVI